MVLQTIKLNAALDKTSIKQLDEVIEIVSKTAPTTVEDSITSR